MNQRYSIHIESGEDGLTITTSDGGVLKSLTQVEVLAAPTGFRLSVAKVPDAAALMEAALEQSKQEMAMRKHNQDGQSPRQPGQYL